MILINLLPHREAARKKRQDDFYVTMGVAAALGMLIIGAGYLWFQMQISAQQDLNMVLQNEIRKLDKEIKEIDKLEEEIASMRARQQAVEDLQSDRNQPIYLLGELVRLTPEGVQLRTLKQEGQVVLIQGAAQSQERVSEFMRNLSNEAESEWLTKPDLVEIVAGDFTLDNKEKRRVANFSLRVQVLKSSETKRGKAEAEAAAKAAAAAGRSAASQAAPAKKVE